MKRIWKKWAAGVIVGGCVLLPAFWLINHTAQRQIIHELRSFIREGDVAVERISISLKRGEARIIGITLKDRTGRPVLRIPKVDVQFHNLVYPRARASIRIFHPVLDVDLAHSDKLVRMLAPDAFSRKSRIDIDRVDVHSGRIRLESPFILQAAETMTFDAHISGGKDTEWSANFRATGPQTAALVVVRLDTAAEQILAGSFAALSTTNIIQPPDIEGIDTSAQSGLRAQITLSDTHAMLSEDLRLNAAFAWGPLTGSFLALHGSDTPGVFTAEQVRFGLGSEVLICDGTQMDVREDEFGFSSRRWTRMRTGLTLHNIHLSASSSSSRFTAVVDGSPLEAEVRRGETLQVRLHAGDLSLPMVQRELSPERDWPVTGRADIQVHAERVSTPMPSLRWTATVGSKDMRLGPDFGRLSLAVDLSMSGSDTGIDDIRGTVYPAAGLPVRVEGRADRAGLRGRILLNDFPMKNLPVIAESFGREIPLVAETGTAALRVDFSLTPDLQLSASGRVHVRQATVRARGFPLRAQGLDVDIPFEHSPDTGTLVLDEAVAGMASARDVVIGPYRLSGMRVNTASRGNKILAELQPLDAFGGTMRAKALFHIQVHPHQQLDIGVDSVSLGEILAPFSGARDALRGRVSGEARFQFQGANLSAARGTVHMRAGEDVREPMRVSRKFLEQLGGAIVRKIKLPRQVPYKNGALKIRLADGRILFDEVTLEAETLLRKVRIGHVRGSYTVRDLIDVLSNVSSENVKIEVGGRKRK